MWIHSVSSREPRSAGDANQRSSWDAPTRERMSCDSRGGDRHADSLRASAPRRATRSPEMPHRNQSGDTVATRAGRGDMTYSVRSNRLCALQQQHDVLL